jgi:hypothetical protein
VFFGWSKLHFCAFRRISSHVLHYLENNLSRFLEFLFSRQKSGVFHHFCDVGGGGKKGL